MGAYDASNVTKRDLAQWLLGELESADAQHRKGADEAQRFYANGRRYTSSQALAMLTGVGMSSLPVAKGLRAARAVVERMAD